MEFEKEVTEFIAKFGRLTLISEDQDIYDAGFKSAEALSLLLELEDAYSVSIPDEDYASARTSRQIASLITKLKLNK